MAKKLFNLKGVPDDEAAEVKELLEQAGLEIYETPPGRWGVSVHALWLRDTERLTEARELLDNYQDARRIRVRQSYLEQRQAGTAPTFWGLVKAQPLRVLVLLIIVLGVLYFSVVPFLRL